jgi:tRNA(Arg) A34 adenosine deaminase TadA
MFSFISRTSEAVAAERHRENSIPQPTTRDAAAFIDRAFDMRRLAIEYGDQAHGAVVVRDGAIIGQSWSRVILDNDPTGHAEISAIRDAARRAGSRDLSGAIIYSSSRPCPMCEAAAYWARIDQMIYGRGTANAGVPRLCR